MNFPQVRQRNGIKVPGGFRTGQRVTNDKGWHGVIVLRPKHWRTQPPADTSNTVYVHWQEREQHEDKLVRKKPVTSNPVEQVKTISHS